MKMRWRAMDAVTAVGLLVVLVFAPAYVAQHGLEDVAGRPGAWTLPLPRDGDRATFDLVLRFGANEPVVVSPHAESTIRRPVGDECQGLGVFVVESVQHPIEATLAWGTVNTTQRRTVDCHDADGRRVWHARQTGDHDAHTERVLHPDGLPMAGASLRYEPDGMVLWPAALRAWAKESWQGGGTARDAFADDVAFYGDRPLYRSMEFPLTRVWAQLYGTGSGTLFGLGDVDFAEKVRWDDQQQWQWFSPEVPFPAGSHLGYTRDGVHVYSRDLVLRGFQAGDGPVVKTGWAADPPLWEPLPPIDDVDVPRIPLGTLQSDDRPLLFDLSLEDLRAHVDAAGLQGRPGHLVDRGARIAEFYWDVTPQGPTGVPGRPEDPHPEVDWYLTLVTEDGESALVRLHLQDDAGWQVTEAEDMCDKRRVGTIAMGAHVHCDAVPRAVGDTDRAVPDPHWVLQQIEATHHDNDVSWNATRPDAFAYLPLLAYDRVGSPLAGQLAGTFEHNTSKYEADGVRTGLAWWAHQADAERASGLVDLRDGHLLRFTHHSALKADPVPSGHVLEDAPRLTPPIGAMGTTTTFVGAALVGVGLLARAWALVRAGGAAPMVATLYARIARAQVLEQERRQGIIDLLTADPGLTPSDIVRSTGWGWGAVIHHLDTLRRNGLLTPMRLAGRQHWFPAGTLDARSRARVAFAGRDGYDTFLRILEARPGLTLTELARHLDRRRPALSKMGSRLAEAGLVEKRRDGASVRFYATSDTGEVADR